VAPAIALGLVEANKTKTPIRPNKRDHRYLYA
jgi:hypothetical protein